MEENALEWKQKYMELLNINKLQDEKIENLTQEKDKYCKKTNELSSELAKTRTQLGEMQSKRNKRTLLEVQSIELEKTRMEISGVQLENSKLKSDLENRDQEVIKLKKEIDSLKSSSKIMKSKIKSLENEIHNTQQMRFGSSSKTSKRTESLEIQVQNLEEKISTLQKQYSLKEQELKLALEDDEYHKDITELLLQMKGKTKEEMDKIYLSKKNATQSKSDIFNTNIDEKILNEINIGSDNKSIPVVENNNTKVLSLSKSNTNTVSNGNKSSCSFGYFDAELNELPGPPIGSVINTTSTFNCYWDSCKKEFESREELKLHLKYDHNLNPNYPNDVIEIND
jgi:chromosome segregation ATPase